MAATDIKAEAESLILRADNRRHQFLIDPSHNNEDEWFEAETKARNFVNEHIHSLLGTCRAASGR